MLTFLFIRIACILSFLYLIWMCFIFSMIHWNPLQCFREIVFFFFWEVFFPHPPRLRTYSCFCDIGVVLENIYGAGHQSPVRCVQGKHFNCCAISTAPWSLLPLKISIQFEILQENLNNFRFDMPYFHCWSDAKMLCQTMLTNSNHLWQSRGAH